MTETTNAASAASAGDARAHGLEYQLSDMLLDIFLNQMAHAALERAGGDAEKGNALYSDMMGKVLFQLAHTAGVLCHLSSDRGGALSLVTRQMQATMETELRLDQHEQELAANAA
ncbi:MAG: hypothetical protein ACXWVD_00515 [Telluria sp.]